MVWALGSMGTRRGGGRPDTQQGHLLRVETCSLRIHWAGCLLLQQLTWDLHRPVWRHDRRLRPREEWRGLREKGLLIQGQTQASKGHKVAFEDPQAQPGTHRTEVQRRRVCELQLLSGNPEPQSMLPTLPRLQRSACFLLIS